MLVQSSFTGLPSLLNRLGDRNIQRILIEGGPTTIHRFLDEGLVDEFYLVKSKHEHGSPVPSEISVEVLEKAGLIATAELVWGEENVEHYTRRTSLNT